MCWWYCNYSTGEGRILEAQCPEGKEERRRGDKISSFLWEHNGDPTSKVWWGPWTEGEVRNKPWTQPVLQAMFSEGLFDSRSWKPEKDSDRFGRQGSNTNSNSWSPERLPCRRQPQPVIKPALQGLCKIYLGFTPGSETVLENLWLILLPNWEETVDSLWGRIERGEIIKTWEKKGTPSPEHTWCLPPAEKQELKSI